MIKIKDIDLRDVCTVKNKNKIIIRDHDGYYHDLKGPDGHVYSEDELGDVDHGTDALSFQAKYGDEEFYGNDIISANKYDGEIIKRTYKDDETKKNYEKYEK